MKPIQFALRASAAGALALAMAASANAATQQLTVTVENLSAANGYATGPLQVGFGNGSFDAFNIGSVASAAIVPVAELGSGSAWQPAFAAADPGAVIGAIGGVLLPSGSASATFTVNTANNSYFSFGAMVVPSNDFFIGNDSPTAYRLFDAAGKLTTASITLKATDIWDAGSEVFDPASAAFVGNAALHTDQHSVVAHNFAELAAFNGLTTAAGYTFRSNLTANSDVYRISFAVAAVPEPESYAMMLAGLAVVSAIARRRRAKSGGLSA